MRRLTLALLLCAALPVWADAANPLPADLKPVPEPPPMSGGDAALEPQVTIIKRAEETVEEYRINGRMYMLKVTPKHGKPYYLIDERGDGKFARQDNLDSGIRVPQWVLFEF